MYWWRQGDLYKLMCTGVVCEDAWSVVTRNKSGIIFISRRLSVPFWSSSSLVRVLTRPN